MIFPFSCLPSLLQYVVQLFLCSLTVFHWLSSCLLLRAIGEGIQLLRLYAVSAKEAASSEQSKEGRSRYL